MDKRTKTLVSIFGLFIAYGAYSSIIGPRWIDPLFVLKDQIAELEDEKFELQAEQRRIENLKRSYRSYVDRAGSFDIFHIEYHLRKRLSELLEEYKLDDTNIGHSQPRTAGKTDIEMMSIPVKASGALESVVKFLRDVSEVPQLVRLSSVKLTPIRHRGRRRSRDKIERVRLDLTLQLMRLPQQKLVGAIEESSLQQPERFVRHENRDYSTIWGKTQFTQYKEYPPLKVTAKEPEVVVEKGKRVKLEAVVTGGDGDFEYEWEPKDGLRNPASKSPSMDTKDTGKRQYSVKVTDGQGVVARATVMVEIKEPPPKVVRGGKTEPPPPPPPSGPKRWSDGHQKKIAMTMISSTGQDREGEVMVANDRTGSTEYFTRGSDFDGGELVFVHKTGAVARLVHEKKSQYYVYPLGQSISEAVRGDQADEYPSLKAAVDWFQKQDPEFDAGESFPSPAGGATSTSRRRARDSGGSQGAKGTANKREAVPPASRASTGAKGAERGSKDESGSNSAGTGHKAAPTRRGVRPAGSNNSRRDRKVPVSRPKRGPRKRSRGSQR